MTSVQPTACEILRQFLVSEASVVRVVCWRRCQARVPRRIGLRRSHEVWPQLSVRQVGRGRKCSSTVSHDIDGNMPCETAGGGWGGGSALRALAAGWGSGRMRWAILRIVLVIPPISGPSIISHLGESSR